MHLFPAAAAFGLLLFFSMFSPGVGHHNHHEHGKHAEVRAEQAKAQFTFPAGRPAAGAPAGLRIAVTDASGAPVEQFDIEHEKLMHLIVVSEDLQQFQHLHPEYEGGGVFGATAMFPAGGRYKLFADFIPHGGAPVTAIGEVAVSGKTRPSAPLVADAEWVRIVDGTEVSLEMGPAAPGAETTLTFRFRDAESGRPADGMETYLGAAGHVVILSAGAETYLHVHPADESAPGPEARFRTAFPTPGLYKIWGQFQREGRLMTVSFVVKV